MSMIRGKNTAPELVVRRYLHGCGLRYRLHQRDLPGKPDLVFPRWNAVVFVHGCFWHQHSGCPFATMPESNREFWREKLEANKRRDHRNVLALRNKGWRVLTIWECQLSERRLRRLAARITGQG